MTKRHSIVPPACVFDTATTVSLIAGAESEGFRDGIGADARFDRVTDLLCASDGVRKRFRKPSNSIDRSQNTSGDDRFR